MQISSKIASFRANALLGPTLIIFLSANLANVANLAFNMIFVRIMTPAQFADLTLLLTIKLGLLSLFSALQYGISEITARRGVEQGRLIAANLTRKSLRFTLPFCFILLLLAEYIGHALNFSNIKALVMLTLAIPLFIPLVIFRGLAQGQLSLPKMVGSLQIEWVVRLGGCFILWQAGFGLPGITVALVLSILAALIFTMDRQDGKALLDKTGLPAKAAILKTAFPYGAIFLAQILALDGDIFIAKSLMSEEDAGAAAGMLLIQRIFFFAFLSFATVLQPIVAANNASDSEAKATLSRLLLAMLAISTIALLAMGLMSQLFVNIFLGSQYLHLAPLVLWAGVVGVSFMAAQLTTIFLIARGKKCAPYFLLGMAIFQFIAVPFWINISSDFTYSEFLMTKTVIIAMGAFLFISCALRTKPKEL